MLEKREQPRVMLVYRCFIFRGEDRQLLFLKRSEGDRYYPGYWEPPGGKLEVGQDVSKALEDEVFEETRLLVVPTHRLVYVDTHMVTQGPPEYIGLPYVVIFSIARLSSGQVGLSDEHSDYRWVSYDVAFTLALKPEVQKAMVALESLLRETVQSP